MSEGSFVRRFDCPKRNFIFQKVRLSEGSIVRRFICLKVRLSKGSFVRRFYYPKAHLSEGSIVRRFFCSKVLLSEGSIIRNGFFYAKLTLLLNISIKKDGVYGVYFFSVLKA